LIPENPGIFRDYFDDFHHFNKGIKEFPDTPQMTFQVQLPHSPLFFDQVLLLPHQA
jgi:hypothetical protein